jgi:hypothetical protein
MRTLSKSLTLFLVITLAAATSIVDAMPTSNPLHSQVWSNSFGGADDEWAFSVISSDDGGYVVAGYTMSMSAGKADAWIVKTDSSGNQQWNRTYGGEGFDWASCVIQTGDGGYAIAGSTNSTTAGDYDCWLIKTDSSGNQQWSRTYGEIRHDYAASVIQTSDGGYALTGIKDSLNDGGYSLAVYRDLFVVGNADAWIIKTDSAGNEQWNKTFGGPNDDGAFSIVQTGDTGYALAGNTYSFSGGNNTDIWLIKIDTSGKEVWNRTFGGVKDDFGYSVIQTGDGGYALAGITNSSGAGLEDAWLIKTDASGNKQWDKTYGSSLNDEAYYVLQTQDGGYAMAGATVCFGAGFWDAWLIKTDSSGNTQWSQTYGGVSDDQITSMVMTSYGFVLCGPTNTFGAGEWDAWLLEISGDTQHSATVPSFNLSPLGPLSIGSLAVLALSITVFIKKLPRYRAMEKGIFK